MSWDIFVQDLPEDIGRTRREQWAPQGTSQPACPQIRNLARSRECDMASSSIPARVLGYHLPAPK
jgi:hypothetical protein